MKKRLLKAALACATAAALALVAPLQTLAFAPREAASASAFGNADGALSGDSQPRILCELTDERTADGKHFLLDDRSVLAVTYPIDVHYRSENGDWVEYDNSFADAGTDEYKNKDSDASVFLAKKAKGNKTVTYSRDGWELSWGYADANKTELILDKTGKKRSGNESFLTLDNVRRSARYDGIYDGVDLELDISALGVKENFVLASRRAQSTFVIEYKLKGLTAEEADGAVALRGFDGERVALIEAPCMTDAAGASSDGLTLSVTSLKTNRMTLTLTADREWLEDDSRVYPVRVDPSVVTSSSSLYSASVSSAKPNDCLGGSGSATYFDLQVGNNAAGGLGTVRSYIGINSLPWLPDGAVVVAAELNAYCTSSSYDSMITVSPALSRWSAATINWSNKPAAGEALDYRKIEKTTAPKAYAWDITRTAKQWYSSTESRRGLVLTASKESADAGFASFCSSTCAETAVRPCISVNYRMATGLENYYTYITTYAGADGAAGVNVLNGALVFSQAVSLTSGNQLMPVGFTLYYDSNLGQPLYAPISIGFQLNYHARIELDEQLAASGGLEAKRQRYSLIDADGTEHRFWLGNSNGDYSDTLGVDEDGLGYKLLVYDGVGTTEYNTVRYEVTDKSGGVMRFNGYGQLMRVTDSAGNYISVIYAYRGSSYPLPTSVVDSSGKSYTLGYQNEHLISITDPIGPETTFAYLDNGLLGSVTVPSGDKTVFTYNDDGKMTSVSRVNSSGAVKHYAEAAYSGKRVAMLRSTSSPTQASAERYVFDYSDLGSTSVTDLQLREFRYQFDNFGRCVAVLSEESGQTQFYEFDDSTNKKRNKLLSSSKVQSATRNYLKNPTLTGSLDGFDIDSNDSSFGSKVEFDASVGHLKAGSAAIDGNTTDTHTYLTQTVTLTAGQYTLSAYVKGATGSLHMNFAASDSSGEIMNAHVVASSEWQRLSAPFTTSGGSVTVKLGLGENFTGSVWLDEIQLERGTGETEFNLIDDNSFTFADSAWTFDGSRIVDLTDSPLGFEKAAELLGWFGACSVAKRVDVSGRQGDVFTAGAWAKAASATLSTRHRGDDNVAPTFRLVADFYNGSTVVGTQSSDFCADVRQWQYNAYRLIAPADFTAVELRVDYSNNLNSCLVTGMTLLREEFGQTYTYDENGNIVSSVDLAKAQSTYAFSDLNELTRMLSPSGTRYIYAYDRTNRSQINYAFSTDSNAGYTLEHDSRGNVTQTTAAPAKTTTVPKSGSSYFLVNKHSGQAVACGLFANDAHIDEHALGMTGFSPLVDQGPQRWRFVSTGATNTFYLMSESEGHPYGGSTNYYMGVVNNLSVLGSPIYEYESTASAAQSFRLVDLSDGTVALLTSASGYTSALNGCFGGKVIYRDELLVE